MTRPRLTTRVHTLLVGGCAAALLAGSAVPSRAGTFAGAMGDLVVPGGRSTLRLADVPDDAPRGTLLPLLVRLLHADPPGAVPEQDSRLARVRARVELIARLEAALSALDRGELTLDRLGEANARPRVEAALAAMGLRLRQGQSAATVEADQASSAQALREALGDAGLDVAGVTASLNAGHAVSPGIGGVALPLPIPAEAWEATLGVRPLKSDALFAAVVLDRTGALMLHGLLAMDGSTRAWAVAQPGLLRGLALSAPAVAAFGRSVRIVGDGMALPGGPGAIPVWEMLARERVQRPDRFVRALFTRDEGRFAYFLDAVGHMTPAQQGLVLGIAPACGAPDLEQAGHTYQAFLLSTGEWLPAERPFLRPVFDAVTVLDVLDVRHDGQPAGPRWKRFWVRAFDQAGPNADPRVGLEEVEEDGDVDPATLIKVTALSDLAGRRARLEQLRFVQRVFPDPPASALPDVLVTARAFARFPALLLALERVGVRDPAAYRASARRAIEIDAIGDGSRRYASLAQFQGALAVIDGVAGARYLDRDRALALAATLVAVPVSGRGYEGGIAGWLASSVMPALRAPMAESIGDPIAEQLLLRAWSGPPPGAASPRLAWEGQDYVADPTAAEFDRLAALRSRQGGTDVGPVLALWQAATNLAAASSPETATLAVDALRRAAAAMPPFAPNVSLPEGDSLAHDVARVPAVVERARAQKDLRKVARALAPIWQQVDRCLAKALLSLAYTPHLGDPDTSVLTGDDVAQRHEFGAASAWMRPEESPEVTGRRVVGALQGLDLSLSRFALRRLASDAVPPPRKVNENVAQEMRETLALARREPPSAGDLAGVAAAIGRGRARVAAAGTDAAALAGLLAAAGAGEWRQAAVGWMAASEPAAVPGLFAESELFALGSVTPVPAAFGTSASGTDGCWCLRSPRARAWEDLAGRPGMPLVAAQLSDVGLSLAVRMHELGVPAGLYPSLLAFAAQDFIDTARPQHPEDWPALALAARLPRERVEDYVSGLVGKGPLRVMEKTTR